VNELRIEEVKVRAKRKEIAARCLVLSVEQVNVKAHSSLQATSIGNRVSKSQAPSFGQFH